MERIVNRGIVYTAWGDMHLNEAVRSATSAHKLGYETCLLSECVDPWKHGFQQAIPISFERFDGLHPSYRKWACLTETPFESSCFLDPDTVMFDRIDLGFDQAERFGFATVYSPGMLFHHAGAEHPHYQGGCLFFCGKRGDFLDELLRQAKIAETAGFVGDEPALGLAFEAMGINPFVLPTVFDTVRSGRVNDRKIKVFHSRHHIPENIVLASDQYGNDFTQ